jgi:hypothetical protein
MKYWAHALDTTAKPEVVVGRGRVVGIRAAKEAGRAAHKNHNQTCLALPRTLLATVIGLIEHRKTK